MFIIEENEKRNVQTTFSICRKSHNRQCHELNVTVHCLKSVITNEDDDEEE